MHASRVAYLVRGEKKVIRESLFLPAAGNGCPMARAAVPHAAPAAEEPKGSAIRFGRMFPPRWGRGKRKAELEQVQQGLIALGRCMNDPNWCHQQNVGKQKESKIPAGYTYLGQFITHEITFDKTEGLPLSQLKLKNARSPSLDLDSLYGARPDGRECQKDAQPDDGKWRRLYEDEGEHPARLKVGKTREPPGAFKATFDNDLPRETDGPNQSMGTAIIGDERNDENLPLAQTHVAFIKFHNRVVEDLERGRYKDFKRPPAERLFEEARAEVVRHFQWIILKDYLPRLVDKDLVKTLTRKPDRLKFKGKSRLFIPLEFSAAAFRFGHSMVRQKYDFWNREHKDVHLSELFINTKRSGSLGGLERLDSTWVIDWKRFYDFTPFAKDYPRPYEPFPYDAKKSFNKAGRIDTIFDLHLDTIEGFNHNGLPLEQRSITVRNLLRGLALGLPWGEDVADALGEKRLERDGLKEFRHAALLDAKPFEGKTPLWFYILKEARVNGKGSKLGRVGGHIVAETLIGLIRHSSYSILRRRRALEPEWELSDWRPAYGRPSAGPDRVKFEMPDLLHAADVVDPLGKKVFVAEQGQH